MTTTRIQKSAVTNKPMLCFYNKPCVYRKDGICDQPRINKGNSDAACYRLGNRALIGMLSELTAASFE